MSMLSDCHHATRPHNHKAGVRLSMTYSDLVSLIGQDAADQVDSVPDAEAFRQAFRSAKSFKLQVVALLYIQLFRIGRTFVSKVDSYIGLPGQISRTSNALYGTVLHAVDLFLASFILLGNNLFSDFTDLMAERESVGAVKLRSFLNLLLSVALPIFMPILSFLPAVEFSGPMDTATSSLCRLRLTADRVLLRLAQYQVFAWSVVLQKRRTLGTNFSVLGQLHYLPLIATVLMNAPADVLEREEKIKTLQAALVVYNNLSYSWHQAAPIVSRLRLELEILSIWQGKAPILTSAVRTQRSWPGLQNACEWLSSHDEQQDSIKHSRIMNPNVFDSLTFGSLLENGSDGFVEDVETGPRSN